MNTYTKFDPVTPPPPLMTGEPASFAQRTMATRIPAIVEQVLADHVDTYPLQINRALQELHDEIKFDRPVRPLETTAADGPEWVKAWQPHRGKSWFNIPWYFAEAFFYRRLLEAAGYFNDQRETTKGLDPFLPRKQTELQSETPWQVLSAALDHASTDSVDSFGALLHHCVWGNRVDLSYNKVAESTGRRIAVDSEQANLLVDDTRAVLAHLKQGSRKDTPLSPSPPAPLPGVDFICDNAGTELLLDLALAGFLLRFDWVERVILHVKAQPTFVSDATPADIDMTIAAIKSQRAENLSTLALRLESHRQQQRLHVQADLFWNSSRFFWEIPPPLQAQLGRAHLVIIKGDANYRRLLGDSRWLTTVPVTDAIPYFPAPFVALRTLKSDPIVGLKPGLAKALDQEDSAWRVNGKRGIIQAVL